MKHRPRIASITAAVVIAGIPWMQGLRAGQAAEAVWTPGARLDAIRRAAVWTKTNVAAMDVKAGPQGSLAFDPGQTVTCDYASHPRGIGTTLKFHCTLNGEHELKVRYGAHNGEVYGQVAATRLLWALGFGANRIYPVRVVCSGCTSNPWNQTMTTGTLPVVFDPAAVELGMSGRTLEVTPDEGWSWKELDLVDDEAGAPAAQRDALKLLAVLIQHGSNKRPNQRMLCLHNQPGEAATPAAGCTHPLMMLTDVGKTFGRANTFDRANISSVNFSEWSRTPVWKDSTRGCIGNLPRSWRGGTLDHPRIGEPGRAFLADLIGQLTDAQLHDIFEVARFPQRDPSATVEDWVNAFKRKRAEIANRRCES